jgi:GAF domain-containing protein
MALSAPLRFALSAWYAFSLLERANEPKPRDNPEIRSGDELADRVLLLGNGPCHGWGVVTHQLGLPGQLARALRGRTGRACDVDYVGAESMDVRSARAWLGYRDLAPYDLVVVVIGLNDAVRRTPVETWRSALTELVAGILPRLRSDAALYLAGVPPIPAIERYDNLVGRLAEGHRRRLQVATVEVLDQMGLPPLIELGPTGIPGPDGAPVYAVHAATIADRLAPRLKQRTSAARPAFPSAEPWDWSGSAAVLAQAAHGGASALRGLAKRAQKHFGVELAVVSLVNGDRLWYAMNTEIMPVSVPLELSFCQHVVEAGEPIVVGNTALDKRFADNPLRQLSFINFYAGVPLQDEAGNVIGSFCLHGSRPRWASRFRLDDLREMALEAQTELRRYELDSSPDSRQTEGPTPDRM